MRKWAAPWQNQQMACAPSEDSDQPGHPPSLIRVLLCTQWVAKDPSFLHADSEDSDQTGRMPKLICVFAGRTCHFVLMRRLKWNAFACLLNACFWSKPCPRHSAVNWLFLCQIYLSRDMTKPTKWHVRPAKAQISPILRKSRNTIVKWSFLCYKSRNYCLCLVAFKSLALCWKCRILCTDFF